MLRDRRSAVAVVVLCFCSAAQAVAQQSFERTLYSLTDSGHGKWLGANPARKLSFEFDTKGVRIRNGAGAVEFRLTGFGYGDRLAKPAAVQPSVTENRLEYRRDGVTEWYVNGRQGLEQGFTFTQRPGAGERNAPLRIALRVSGGFRPVLRQGAVLLGAAFRYAGLTARDARGRTLPSRLEVRGHEIRLLVEEGEAEYPLTIDPTWSQQTTLIAPDGAGGDEFGNSMALSGNIAVIGSPTHQVGSNSGQGAAYVYVRSGTTWSLQAELTASDSATDDNFGYAVALSGSTAIVTAYQHKVGTHSYEGAAYVFVQSGTTWSQQQELTPSDGALGDEFGSSVAMSGSIAVIGAVFHQVGGVGTGAAYVFVQSGTTWSQQAELTSSDGVAYDLFGEYLALSGGTALVSALDKKVGSHSYQGAAYIFVQSGITWSQQQQLTASNGAANDVFGSGVAILGGTALISADERCAGAVYVFTQSGSTWTQQQQFTSSDGQVGDLFGFAIALGGGAGCDRGRQWGQRAG